MRLTPCCEGNQALESCTTKRGQVGACRAQNSPSNPQMFSTVPCRCFRVRQAPQRRAGCRADKMCRDVVSAPKDDFVGEGKSFKVTFLTAGDQSTTVDCPDDSYILDAAEAQGLDLPATCRGEHLLPPCVLLVDQTHRSVGRSDPPRTLREDQTLRSAPVCHLPVPPLYLDLSWICGHGSLQCCCGCSVGGPCTWPLPKALPPRLLSCIFGRGLRRQGPGG